MRRNKRVKSCESQFTVLWKVLSLPHALKYLTCSFSTHESVTAFPPSFSSNQGLGECVWNPKLHWTSWRRRFVPLRAWVPLAHPSVKSTSFKAISLDLHWYKWGRGPLSIATFQRGQNFSSVWNLPCNVKNTNISNVLWEVANSLRGRDAGCNCT